MDKRHIGIIILAFVFTLCVLAIGIFPVSNNIWALALAGSRTVKIIIVLLTIYGTFYFLRPVRSMPVKTMATMADPFAERDEIDARLLAANSFIRAGRYTEARAILEPIKSDPKAAQWLKKLSDPKYK